uniref:AMP-binding domain-containing protein n=1 Tax=Trichobilharzia regenti TaxID=157069 RepID=A0AA85JI80_TRIRE|nr:unnamed protein product [Trichobilharzia regenti]
MSLRWPCFLKDCVSPRWKADEHCIEFWNGISRSSGVETLSYGDFQKYSDELVELFRRHLIFAPNNSNRTPVVAIIWAPHILTSVVTHGIVKSGIPFFPILSSSASSGLRPLIDHIDAIVWLCNPIDVIPIDGFLNYQATSTNTLDSVFSRDDWCLLLRSSLSSSSKADIFANPFTLPNSHLAYIISTSGSFSDERKLVCVADSCLTANILDLGMRFPSDDHCSPEENSVVLASPLTFDPSIVQIYFSLLSHRTLVMCPSSILSQSKALSLLCINANVDWLQCTPSQLSGLDRHLLKRLLSQPRLKVLLGGEPFPLNEFINIKKYKATLYNIYGTTEVSSWSHLFKVNGPDEDLTNDDIYCKCSPPVYGSSPLGFPMLGTTFSLIPSTSANVWELGLSREFGGFSVIRTKGPTVTVQEFSDALSQLNVKTIWPTADLVHYGQCGKCLWFLGRKDRIVKRLGYQICLERLEHAIKMCKLPGIRIKNCRCQVSKKSTSRNFTIAFIEIGCCSSKTNNKNTSKVLLPNRLKWLKLHIVRKLKAIFTPNPEPWIPTQFVFSCHPLPVSSHGKLIYRPYRVFKFSTLAKSRLISVWKESLGLDNMNILDKRLTFLEAGGSSLMALNLIETIIQEFPNLTNRRNKLLSSIFTHPFSRICQLILRSSHTSTRPRKHPTKFSSFKETDQSKSSDVEMNIEYRHQSPFSLYTSGSSLHLSNLLHRDAIRLIWRHDLLKCVDASPVIISGPDRLMDGCAFVGSHSGLFSAIRVPDGCPLWSDSSVPISGRIEASCAYAYMGSTSILTVGTLSGNICALDIEQGTVLCSYDTGGAVKSPTTYIHDYRFLVCGSHSKLIHAVDLRSLTEMRPVWTNPFDGSPIVSPITVSRTSDTNTPYLVVASLGGSFGCLDPRNPANLVWMQHAKIPIFNKPLLYFDSNNKVNIIIAAVSGRIQSWSLLNGTLNWSYECSKELNGHAIFSDPVFDCQSNSVIISTNKGFMFALNVLSGNLVWMLDCRFDLSETNLCSLNTPSLLCTESISHNTNKCLLFETRADGLLFTCSLPALNTSLSFVQVEYPDLLTTYRLPDQCFSSPVVYSQNSNDVHIVTGCRDNYVYGFSI